MTWRGVFGSGSWVSLGSLVIALAAGCGGGGGDKTGSCDTAASNRTCVEYTGPSGSVDGYKSTCSNWNDSGCPSADKVGGCRSTLGEVEATYWYYAPATTSEAMANCVASTFVSP